MVLASAGMVAADSAKEDGGFINSALKLAIIAVIVVLLIGISIYAYFIVVNWDFISGLLGGIYTFFAGGVLGLINPFKKGGISGVTSQVVADVGSPKVNTGYNVFQATGWGWIWRKIF